MRLVLLTYVAELSPFPLPGLTAFDDIAMRLALLCEDDTEKRSLEELLARGDDLVEFGVKRMSERVVHTGLRFRSQTARDAVPVLLKALPIRREFRRLLLVVGEREACPACKKDVFVVPLFRTHGLDDLRANVCPACGHVLRSYWMPKGKDVQAILNAAFLDMELVCEWSFQLGRATIGIQLLPLVADGLRVRDIKERFVADVLTRYALEIEPSDVSLEQDGRVLLDKAKLVDLPSRHFDVRFAEGTKLREGEALEIVRHRVRARFRGG